MIVTIKNYKAHEIKIRVIIMIILRVDSFTRYAYSRRILFFFSHKYVANEPTLNIDILRDYCTLSNM